LASNTVQAIASQQASSIGSAPHDLTWIGTNMGLCRFDSGVPSFITLTTNDGLPSANVHSVVVLSNGNKLIGTNSGIALYNGY